MEFPPTWEVFPSEDFETAAPRSAGDPAMELKAQVRPNGRIMDHFAITMSGPTILECHLPMNHIIPRPGLVRWTLRYQQWARDIEIRRNMTSSKWMDVRETIAAKEATVLEDGVEVPYEEVLAELDAPPPLAARSASIRWAVVVNEDHKMRLDLQSLPGTAETLSSKPLLRG